MSVKTALVVDVKKNAQKQKEIDGYKYLKSLLKNELFHMKI